MSKEIWKDVEGAEGFYAISNLGRVKNITRGNILSPVLNSKGYHVIQLGKGVFKKKILSVHRLVAKAFCDGFKEELFVNHINGIKTHNTALNLEWCTPKENAIHAANTGLIAGGSDAYNSKLTDLQVREIYFDQRAQQKIADEYGVSQRLISRIHLKRGYKNVIGGFELIDRKKPAPFIGKFGSEHNRSKSLSVIINGDVKEFGSYNEFSTFLGASYKATYNFIIKGVVTEYMRIKLKERDIEECTFKIL